MNRLLASHSDFVEITDPTFEHRSVDVEVELQGREDVHLHLDRKTPRNIEKNNWIDSRTCATTTQFMTRLENISLRSHDNRNAQDATLSERRGYQSNAQELYSWNCVSLFTLHFMFPDFFVYTHAATLVCASPKRTESISLFPKVAPPPLVQMRYLGGQKENRLYKHLATRMSNQRSPAAAP